VDDLVTCRQYPHPLPRLAPWAGRVSQFVLAEGLKLLCQECGHEQIGHQVQTKIDRLLDRAAKGKIKERIIVM